MTMTNAEKIARNGGQAVIDFFIKGFTECPYTRNKGVCNKPISCRVCWCDWLTQEAPEEKSTKSAAVEVVRCKDCYAYQRNLDFAKAAGLNPEEYCALLRCEFGPDGFCSYGRMADNG